MSTPTELEIRWSTRDVDGVVRRLRDLGFAVDRAGRIAFRGATIAIVEGTGRDDRLAVRDGPGAHHDGAGHPNGIRVILAVGWATVDTGRVIGALAGETIEPSPADPHLGAAAIRVGPSGPYRLILEPSTEGRLAATLARLGEGPVAVYLSAGERGLGTFVADARTDGAMVSAILPGPFGPSVILPGGPAWGPHLLVVEPRPGT